MTTSLSFERIADRYDETRFGIAERQRIADFLEPWLVPGPAVEVGVGTGLIAGVLRDRGHTVYGVDLSPAMLARARERLGDGLICGDACALPIRSGTMANVVFAASLHVIRDVQGAFAAAARVLRPGGRIVAKHDEAVVVPVGGGTDDVMETLAPLTRLKAFARPDTQPALEAAARAAGLATVCLTMSEQVLWRASPEFFARQLEGRVWSALWHIDDDSWNHVVIPMIAQLRALPDPDRPRPRNLSYPIAVFEVNAAARPPGSPRRTT